MKYGEQKFCTKHKAINFLAGFCCWACEQHHVTGVKALRKRIGSREFRHSPARWFWAYSFPFWSILSSSVKQTCCVRLVPVHSVCVNVNLPHVWACITHHSSSMAHFSFQIHDNLRIPNNYSQRVGGGMWHATHFLSWHHSLRFGELPGLNACPVAIWEVNSFRHYQVQSVSSFWGDLLPFSERLTQWLEWQRGPYVNPAEGPKWRVPRKVGKVQLCI